MLVCQKLLKVRQFTVKLFHNNKQLIKLKLSSFRCFFLVYKKTKRQPCFFFIACNIEVLVGFDVSAQNIFSSQTNLQSKMGAILQRISKMAPISCSSGQIPSVQVGMLAMDSASEPAQLDFTDNADELFEGFRALRNRGPFLLNGKTISAYTNRFKTRQDDVVKVSY